MKTLWLLPVVCLLPSLAVPAAEDTKDLTPAAVKKLIPAASSLSTVEWKVLARSTTALTPSSMKDKRLSFLLIAMHPRDTKAGKAEFRYADGYPPRPRAVSKELERWSVGAGEARWSPKRSTLLWSDRIHDVKVNVRGETATGSFTFKIPGLYVGKASYTARRRDGEWRIEEFRMPAYELKTKLGKDGIWTLVKKERKRSKQGDKPSK